ncbi:hypothetical protein [Caulobacter sp. SSI4214]|uniref:hypothetical protein n=1 Tax=Caulobacter sp. SSI4214 TaxID=2575739 RepID=UPI0015896CCF|nr:hypothetical protein [Caulobacter sp. SSI4214]
MSHRRAGIKLGLISRPTGAVFDDRTNRQAGRDQVIEPFDELGASERLGDEGAGRQSSTCLSKSLAQAFSSMPEFGIFQASSDQFPKKLKFAIDRFGGADLASDEFELSGGDEYDAP